jgi:hypothetical protein
MVNKDNNGNWDKPTGSDLLDREVPGFFINLGPTGARALISRNAPCPASHVSPPHKLSHEFADSSLGVNLRSSNQRRAAGWICIPSVAAPKISPKEERCLIVIVTELTFYLRRA